MLFVALIVTALVPLGVIDVTGPLAARIALLVVPAVMAVAAGQAGAGGSLLTRSGTTAVTVAAIGGALVAEEADLHALALHSAPGILAGLAVHLPGFLFLVLGLGWRAKLPEEGAVDGSCACEPRSAEATSGQAGAGPTAGPEVLR